MKVFIISLSENNFKRRKHIQAEFGKKDICFKFFDAITPDKNAEILSRYNLDNTKTKLTKREISCFLSHYVLWQEIIENNIQIAGVFEDDIYLGDNAEDFFKSDEWIDPNIDVIKLEKGWQNTIKTPFKAERSIYNRKLYKLQSAHYGTAGYIISNKGAKYLIEKYRTIESIRALDIVMFELLLKEKDYKVQQLLPAICIQDFILHDGVDLNFKSLIEEDRSKNYIAAYQVKKKNVWFKIKRELARPFKDLFHFLYDFFFTRSVKFK